MAVGTRTAPTVADGTANKTVSTMHLLDASGDLNTEAIESLATPIETAVEQWAAKYLLSTQASLWKVSQTQEWVGERDPDNAGTDQRNSVKNGINLLNRNVSTLDTQTPRLVAPILAVMQGNQDIPLLSSTEMTELIVAMLALLPSYTFDSAQYTDRRERNNNPRIKA